MSFDYWLFDSINGLAGHVAWLDVLGRYLAVYGLLGAILLMLAVAWWPTSDTAARARFLKGMLVVALGCAVMLLFEWVVTSQILHHELRARPANARWATLLVTEESHSAFPAWPALIALAMAFPQLAYRRVLGSIALVLSLLLALALIFVGINYPFDVITGLMLGGALGYSAMRIVALGGWRNNTWRMGAAWLAVLVWGAIMAVTIKPVHPETAEAPVGKTSAVTVTPPAAVTKALQPLGHVVLHAATNGHIVVASCQLILPTPQQSLPTVQEQARTAVNTLFAKWPTLHMVTVDISANFAKGATRPRVGTLYTATVTRDAWPAHGFAPGHALPGKKFYHAQFYRQASANIRR